MELKPSLVVVVVVSQVPSSDNIHICVFLAACHDALNYTYVSLNLIIHMYFVLYTVYYERKKI